MYIYHGFKFRQTNQSNLGGKIGGNVNHNNDSALLELNHNSLDAEANYIEILYNSNYF